MKKLLLTLISAISLLSCTNNSSEAKREAPVAKVEDPKFASLDSIGVDSIADESSVQDPIEIPTLKPAIDPKEVEGGEVVLTFMEEYMRFSNSRRPGSQSLKIGPIKWVGQHKLVTQSFKTNHQKLYDEAEKADPEYGLGFDPVFNAQDNPDKGFIITSVDGSYITLQGKDMPQFEVVVKVTKDRGQWLVDGAGVINIPERKRGVEN